MKELTVDCRIVGRANLHPKLVSSLPQSLDDSQQEVLCLLITECLEYKDGVTHFTMEVSVTIH